MDWQLLSPPQEAGICCALATQPPVCQDDTYTEDLYVVEKMLGRYSSTFPPPYLQDWSGLEENRFIKRNKKVTNT